MTILIVERNEGSSTIWLTRNSWKDLLSNYFFFTGSTLIRSKFCFIPLNLSLLKFVLNRKGILTRLLIFGVLMCFFYPNYLFSYQTGFLPLDLKSPKVSQRKLTCAPDFEESPSKSDLTSASSSPSHLCNCFCDIWLFATYYDGFARQVWNIFANLRKFAKYFLQLIAVL